MPRKAIVLKDLTAEGEVQANIATLDVVDKDGDVTVKGFFGKQHTSIVGSHEWQDIMLGKGVVDDSDGKQALWEGQLNLDDPAAEQLHSKLRFDMQEAHGPPLIEWSYGFTILEGGSTRLDPKEHDGARQRLHPKDDGTPGTRVHEVSPVMLGAGEGTGTVAVKAPGARIAGNVIIAGDGDLKLHEHVQAVVTAMDALTTRVGEVVALRADNGKQLGADTMAALDELTALHVKLAEVLTSPADVPSEEQVLLLLAQTETRLRGHYARAN